MKHLCPHCNEDCMTSMQKLFCGSVNTRACRSCGKGVYIAWKHTLWIFLPLLLLLFGSRLLELDTVTILLLGIPGLVLLSLVQIYLLPLSKDKIDARL